MDNKKFNFMPAFSLINFLDCIEYEFARENYSLEYIEYLKKLPYSEYLQSEHWKQLRYAVLNKYGHKCEICGATDKEIHAHHKTYLNKGHEHLYEISCLCSDCHKEIHEIAKQLPKSIPFKDITQEMLDKINVNYNKFRIVKDLSRKSIGIDLIR